MTDIIISIALGLLLVLLFKQACIDNKCINIREVLPTNEISKYHWKVDDICYKYKTTEVPCTQ